MKYSYDELINILVDKIQSADAILVGAGSGLSASAGYTFWYEGDAVFLKEFKNFNRRYCFRGAFNGFYYRYRTPEERWAYIARLIHLLYELPTGNVYYNLMDLLKGKNYHILTTNQDFQFTGVVPEEKISAIQGDWRYFQCSRRCIDQIYYNKDQVYEMNAAIRDTEIPTDLIPKCPRCGAAMEPWVRGYTFLEGEKYREEHRKLNVFLRRNQDKKILFMEIGVGRMTPMFIQEPFWNLTYQLPDAFYININPNDALVPRELEGKGMAFHEDIKQVLYDAKERRGVIYEAV